MDFEVCYDFTRCGEKKLFSRQKIRDIDDLALSARENHDNDFPLIVQKDSEAVSQTLQKDDTIASDFKVISNAILESNRISE